MVGYGHALDSNRPGGIYRDCGALPPSYIYQIKATQGTKVVEYYILVSSVHENLKCPLHNCFGLLLSSMDSNRILLLSLLSSECGVSFY